MFASASEYYRKHPHGDLGIARRSPSISSFQQTSQASMLVPSVLPSRQTSTTLRLSGAMFMEDAMDEIIESIVDPDVERMNFTNLGIDALVYDEEELEETALAKLTTSRSWRHVELHSCQRIAVLLRFLMNVGVGSLCFKGGQELDREAVEVLAQALSSCSIQRLEFHMTLPREDQLLFYNDDDDSSHSGDEEEEPPRSAMQVLSAGLCHALTELRDLDLYLSRRDVPILAEYGLRSNTSLQRLDLRVSSLVDADVAVIVRSVAQHPTLRELDIRGGCHCRQETLRALAANHRDGSKLLCLRITHQDFTNDRVPGLMEFFSSLSQSELQVLDMEEYRIGDEDIQELALAMQSSSISELRLLSCDMTDQAMELFCQGLPHMSSLKRLGMPGNAAAELLRVLPMTTVLQELQMPTRSSKHEQWLDMNRGGRRILQQVQVPSALWPHVLDHTQRQGRKYYGGKKQTVTILYHMLQTRILLEQ